MKYTNSAVLAALVATETQAIKMKAEPDVYGSNGENYQNVSANYDLSRIGINITEKGKGPECDAPNWATLHWRSILGDGREIENTRERFGEGQISRPDVITVGSRQSFNCFDIALPQLREGDKATLKCPSYYAYGGAHTISPLSDFTIPLNSDVTFEVEMLKCGVAPHVQDPTVFTQPHTTTMQPNKCIVFRSYHEQGSGNTDFVLSTVPYEGNDALRQLSIEHYQVDDKDQQWYYDDKYGQIYNSAYPDLRVDSHAGEKRRIVLAKRNDANQFQNSIDYTSFDQLLTSEAFPFTVDHDTNYVTYAGAFGGPGGEYGGIPQHWHIEYCKGEPQVRTWVDLGYKEGFAAKYWFFGKDAPTQDGYDSVIAGKGAPSLVTSDEQLDFPTQDEFSAHTVAGGTFPLKHFRSEWDAKLMIDRTGDYTFKLCSDDGSRLSINEIPVVGNWGLHGLKCVEDIRSWTAGWHDLQVQHFANEGGAMLSLQYKGYDTQDKFVNVQAYRVPVAAAVVIPPISI